MAQSPAIARSDYTEIHPLLSSNLLRPMSATAPGAAHTVGASNAAATKEYRRRRCRTRRLLPHCPLGSQRHLLHHRPAPLLPFQARRVHCTVSRTVRRPRPAENAINAKIPGCISRSRDGSAARAHPCRCRRTWRFLARGAVPQHPPQVDRRF